MKHIIHLVVTLNIHLVKHTWYIIVASLPRFFCFFSGDQKKRAAVEHALPLQRELGLLCVADAAIGIIFGHFPPLPNPKRVGSVDLVTFRNSKKYSALILSSFFKKTVAGVPLLGRTKPIF